MHKMLIFDFYRQQSRTIDRFNSIKIRIYSNHFRFELVCRLLDQAQTSRYVCFSIQIFHANAYITTLVFSIITIKSICIEHIELYLMGSFQQKKPKPKHTHVSYCHSHIQNFNLIMCFMMHMNVIVITLQSTNPPANRHTITMETFSWMYNVQCTLNEWHFSCASNTYTTNINESWVISHY